MQSNDCNVEWFDKSAVKLWQNYSGWVGRKSIMHSFVSINQPKNDTFTKHGCLTRATGISINKLILNQGFTYVYNVITTRKNHNQMLLYISLHIKSLHDVNTYEIWYHVIHEHQNWLLRYDFYNVLHCMPRKLWSQGGSTIYQRLTQKALSLLPPRSANYHPNLMKLDCRQ